MIELYFDILEDLSDELSITDYFHFMTINDLTHELQYKIIRCVEYYYNLIYSHGTPIDYVCQNGDLDVAKWLYRSGVKVTNRALNLACRDGHLEVVEWLVSVDTKYAQSPDARYMACVHGQFEVIKFLRNDVKGHLNSFEMDAVALGGHLEILKWYNEYIGESCTQYALVKALENGHTEIVEYLHEKCGIPR